MKITNSTKFFLGTTIGLIIYIFFLQGCGGLKSSIGGFEIVKTYKAKMKVPKVYTLTEQRIDVRYLPGENIIDSIPYTDSNYCKQLAIDYLTRNVYRDTIKGDTADIYLYQSITQNKVDTTKIGFRINIPFTNTIVMPYKARNEYYIHGLIGTDLKGFQAMPVISLKDKRNFIYSIGVAFNTTGQISYFAGFGFNLSFKKPLK